MNIIIKLKNLLEILNTESMRANNPHLLNFLNTEITSILNSVESQVESYPYINLDIIKGEKSGANNAKQNQKRPQAINS